MDRTDGKRSGIQWALYVLGMIGALATSSVLRSQLFGVTPRDPLTLIAVAGILGGLGLAASYVPARRARRLDPIAALRRE